MGKKIRVGVLFGGKSAEHEVSILSARNVVAALDPGKYEVVLIGIDKKGQWFLNESSRFLLQAKSAELPALSEGGGRVTLVATDGKNEVVRTDDHATVGQVDVVFPVLHGPFGEDGTIQGLLKVLDVPFVGGGVLGSAVGMDKDVMKRLLRDAGLPIGDFRVVHRHLRDRYSFARLRDELDAPFFVKPANLGSSVGISKVAREEQFLPAMDDAFTYDTKVVVEAFIQGREIEVSVLGNETPVASVPGEIIPHHDFYSYEAKYLDEQGAGLEVPAKLSAALVRRFQDLAVRTFEALCCEGMARVDFFLGADDAIIVNEINTIPGFTRISMYPKLWEASGLSRERLVDRLVELALERHEREHGLKTSR